MRIVTLRRRSEEELSRMGSSMGRLGKVYLILTMIVLLGRGHPSSLLVH